jgi:RNA recognition motif-containing protein
LVFFKGKGIGFVVFKAPEGAKAAIELNGSTFLSRKIRVLKYSRKDRKERRHPEKVVNP